MNVSVSQPKSRPGRRGVETGGASQFGLVRSDLSFLSLLGLSRIFWDFADFFGDFPSRFVLSPCLVLSKELKRPARNIPFQDTIRISSQRREPPG